MTAKVKILPIFWIFAFFLLILPSPTFSVRHPKNSNNNIMANTTQQFNKGLETFGIRLFTELAEINRQKNIVFSPFSIQVCLAMARMGAEGNTALEMDKGLALAAQNPEDMAKNYHSILAVYETSPILKIANKIYVMQGYEIQEKFNELLTKQFFSSVDPLNFANNAAAAQIINSWVESKTNNLIKDLISPQALSADSRLVLVNAIHFKGEWVYQFPEHNTRERDFYLDETTTTKVQMMRTTERFRYGEFPDLDATALEMPYKDSDLSMLIILPNSRTGLVALEEKLKNVSLPDLTQRMYSTKVIVDMPKFKAEFEVELTEPLKKLGMSRMFSNAAEFGKMLKSSEPLQVSKVIHKAFIEVNEKGTEAAAATATVIRKKRALVDFSEIIEFSIKHSFIFKILQRQTSESSPLNSSSLELFAGKIHEIVTSTIENTTNQMRDEL